MSIQFFVTKDRALLDQYFELRNRIFRMHYPHLPEDFGREEHIDHVSEIVVGYDGHVVAGGRITISTPLEPRLLPMEEGGWKVAEVLPEFRLDRVPYAEFSRVVVHPHYAAGRRCALGLISHLASVTAELGVDLAFSICPAGQVRLNRMNSRHCGVDFYTFPAVPVRTPFAIEMTLCGYAGLIAAWHGFQRLSA